MKNIETILFIAIAAPVIFMFFHQLNVEPSKCVEESVVTQILSLNYRSADIKLADGTVVTVHQANLKPGDKFCKAYSKN